MSMKCIGREEGVLMRTMAIGQREIKKERGELTVYKGTATQPLNACDEVTVIPQAERGEIWSEPSRRAITDSEVRTDKRLHVLCPPLSRYVSSGELSLFPDGACTRPLL